MYSFFGDQQVTIKKLAALKEIESAEFSWATLIQSEVLSDAQPPVD
jgi:hypothetical protein